MHYTICWQKRKQKKAASLRAAAVGPAPACRLPDPTVKRKPSQYGRVPVTRTVRGAPASSPTACRRSATPVRGALPFRGRVAQMVGGSCSGYAINPFPGRMCNF